MSSRKDIEESLKALVFADNCGAGDPGPPVGAIDKLLNIPTLSWQLSTLARYGVKEAIVLSSRPVECIYEDPLGRMKVTTLSSSTWTGEGDAIRDVESRDGMRPVDDFVVVRQGTVFNIDVAKLVAAHKQRKEADRNWLITTTFRKGAGSASSGLIIGVDSATGTLLKYAEDMDERGFAIDVHAENSGLLGGGTVEICANVLDVGLDVCAPDFLLEFRENFYYDTVRAYIKEKLEGGEAEVFGNRMYVHYLDSAAGQYGTRIHSLASFVQATADVLNGWMSPISVSTVEGTVREEKLQEFQSEYLLERSIVGMDVSVAVGSTILESVIGENVTIGSDVTIRRSILMDGTVIGDRCDIDQSIINKDCTIEESCIIPKNCFLDSGVCIGPDFRDMSPHSLITLKDPEEFVSDEEDESEGGDEEENATKGSGERKDTTEQTNGAADIEMQEDKWIIDHVGMGGKGHLVDMNVSMKMDPMFVPKTFQLENFESDEEDELEDDDEDLYRALDRDSEDVDGEVDGLAGELDNATLDSPAIDRSRIEKFNQEVLETIERAYAEQIEVDNTTLEVNSLKLVYHCSFAETLTGVVAGLARTAMLSCEPEDEELFAGVYSALQKYESVVAKFNRDELSHHVEVAKGIASALGEHGTLVKYVFKAMYDKDMLMEEGILDWASSERNLVKAGAGNATLLATLSDLLNYFEASEEEE